jgi:hypothetical protein
MCMHPTKWKWNLVATIYTKCRLIYCWKLSRERESESGANTSGFGHFVCATFLRAYLLKCFGCLWCVVSKITKIFITGVYPLMYYPYYECLETIDSRLTTEENKQNLLIWNEMDVLSVVF